MPRAIALPLLALVCAMLWSCGEPQQAGRDPKPRDAGTLAARVLRHPAADLTPKVEWRDGARERAPMSLTAGDGQGLRLVALRGTVVIEDPIAFTELHLQFDNPEPRRREGRFEIDLPRDAALSRLAMKIAGDWMEGEVVERRSGQATYETYVHDRPRVDPMLLESAGGSRVAARVFPIEPHQRKEIIVSYSQSLSGGPYRLPLAGLPRIDALDVQVVVKSGRATAPASEALTHALDQRVVDVVQRDFAPTEDLVVSLSGAGDAAAVRSGNLAVVRVRPDALERTTPLEGLTILFDTSASAALGFDGEVDRLVALLSALGDAPVRIAAFDQGVEVLYDGMASKAGADVRAGIRERRAFGASDLHAALGDPSVLGAGHPRVLLWTDGIATAGLTDRASLTRAARALAASGVLRIDALASGSTHDQATLEALARAASQGGLVIGSDIAGEQVADRLRRASYGDVGIDVEGATWIWPASLHGRAPGDDLTIYAAFDGPAPDTLRIAFADPSLASHLVVARDGATPLVGRAVAWARIRHESRMLDAIDPADTELLASARARIVALSTEHRVLSEYTAMLVLESESEYRLFGIDRKATSEILTVGPGGVRLLPREEGHGARFADRGQRLRSTGPGSGLGLRGTGHGGGGSESAGSTMGGTIGLGSIGLIGKSGGGGTGAGYGAMAGTRSGMGAAIGPSIGTGSGWGRSSDIFAGGMGFGHRGRPTARVVVQVPQVRGSLDASIVRRIVRMHANEIRFCYNQGLARKATLAGRVTLQFTIAVDGSVSDSKAASSTLGDTAVSECMAKAVRRWKFPAPTGSVNVTFPFELAPPGTMRPMPRPRPRPRGKRRRARAEPWSGRFATVHQLLERDDATTALDEAFEWAAASPDDVLAILALGRTLEEAGRSRLAARVYGSLVDLHPYRADMRRAAAARLATLGEAGLALAIDSAQEAVALRPDHPNGHRQLAWTLARAGLLEEAFVALRSGLAEHWPRGRFAGARKTMADDLGVIAAAWRAQAPDPAVVDAALDQAGVRLDTTASLRVVAHWESDATDVDLTVKPEQRRAARGRKVADVRTGYGPEAWVVRGPRRPQSVTASVHYYERGPMGAAIGTVEAIAHDGRGGLRFQAAPFVLMEAGGALELGRFSI